MSTTADHDLRGWRLPKLRLGDGSKNGTAGRSRKKVTRADCPPPARSPYQRRLGHVGRPGPELDLGGRSGGAWSGHAPVALLSLCRRRLARAAVDCECVPAAISTR